MNFLKSHKRAQTSKHTTTHSNQIKVELYWSEGDITWTGYLDFSVVCLHQKAATIKENFAFAFAVI